MTEPLRPSADLAELRAAIEQLGARLDRIEARAARSSALATAETRLSAAWAALRGAPRDGVDAATASRRGPLGLVLITLAALLALILAVELVEEVVDGLWHLGRWLD